LVELSR